MKNAFSHLGVHDGVPFGKKTKEVRTISNHSANTVGDCSTEDGSGNRRHEESEPTQVMLERWSKSNSMAIPLIDQKDIYDENMLLNPLKTKGPKRQHNPEFTHSSYLRLR